MVVTSQQVTFDSTGRASVRMTVTDQQADGFQTDVLWQANGDLSTSYTGVDPDKSHRNNPTACFTMRANNDSPISP